MSFTDFWFYPKTAALLLIVLLVQVLFRKRTTVANTLSKLLLLAYSFYTLVYYNWQFAVCLGGVILITYVAAILVDRFENNVKKRTMVISIVVLLVILGVFKYLNFFAGSFARAAGLSWTDLNIVLPLGISFYVFSAISYIVDVYWGLLPADRNLLNVSLFLAFFPKLVCGPIVKGRNFIPQLQQYRRITLTGFEQGIQIFVFGLFKKMVLADHIAVFVDDVYRTPVAYNTPTVWFAVFSYFLQLYFDFSGYSDMAIGLFRILGYDVEPNFNLPFISTNNTEFWNRWHISLGSWMTEYVFNPIALSWKRRLADKPKEIRRRYKNVPTYFAAFVTFLLVGVWHGAGWTFVIFGLLHGGTWIAQHMYAGSLKKHKVVLAENKPEWLHIIDILLCYFWVTMIEVLFRADSLGAAGQIYQLMFTARVGLAQPYTWSFFGYAVLIVATLLACRKARKSGAKEVHGYYPLQDLSTIKGLTIFFVLCGLIIILGYFGETYFIYGQF